jgi:hypothetical protein
MTMSKRLGVVLLVGAMGFLGFELGGRLSIPGIYSSSRLPRPSLGALSLPSAWLGSHGARRGAAQREYIAVRARCSSVPGGCV